MIWDIGSQISRRSDYALPVDTIPPRLFVSVHYYTPWKFCGMTADADWGKMAPTWGSPSDVAELDRLFDMMQGSARSGASRRSSARPR